MNVGSVGRGRDRERKGMKEVGRTERGNRRAAGSEEGRKGGRESGRGVRRSEANLEKCVRKVVIREGWREKMKS